MSRAGNRAHESGRESKREKFLRRQEALEKFARWERLNPSSATPQAVLSGVGWLYDLLPPQARKRSVDTKGVRELQRQLSVLTPVAE
ncbi:MAG: hypothetical protein IH936_13660 [Acidobacteria bacterium]|nr:hypothetical protein [Acidobacteriota bacterium]